MKTMSITQEEQMAYDNVKTILSPFIDTERLSLSESKSYLRIILDGNSHRTICRIYLTPKGHCIGVISERKVETKVPLKCIDDITHFAPDLIKTMRCYDR